MSSEWEQEKKDLIERETKFCLAPAINPICDLGSNGPMKTIIFLGAIQYVDSTSFGWRKKVIVGKYQSFPAFDERGFREELRKYDLQLSNDEFELEIESLIQKLERKYYAANKIPKSAQPVLSNNISLSQSSNVEGNNNNANNNQQGENKNGDDNDNDDDAEMHDNENIDNDELLSQEIEEPFIAISDANQFEQHHDRSEQAAQNKETQDFLNQIRQYQHKEPSQINIWGRQIESAEQKAKEISQDLSIYRNTIQNFDEDDNIDDEDDDDFGRIDPPRVVRKIDIWRDKNYQMYVWKRNDGSQYRVFTQNKTQFTLASIIQQFIGNWKILCEAWTKQNEKKLVEYERAKAKHDKANKKRIKKRTWKPVLEFDNYWSTYWTTDFGM